MTEQSSNLIVTVARQFNDYRTARYSIDQVSGLHWDSVSGGVNAVAPQPFVHGYVQCDGMIDGELAHSGAHGPCPHNIKVCLTKKKNIEVWSEVEKRAGPRPKNSPDPERAATNAKKRRFKDRGLSTGTVTALIAAGIDAPERLLFLDFGKHRLPGIGPAKLKEIESYRATYIPGDRL
jgi:hypothetical protein